MPWVTVRLDTVALRGIQMRGVATGPGRLLHIACVILALATVVAGRQQTFKTGAHTVAVYATVTDAEGRLVPDLGRGDFEIYDNGKLQPLTIFANDIQPITIVVMLDRSGSMQANFRLVEAAAEAFVKRLLPADKARIGSFAARIQIDPPDFTSDKEELIRHPPHRAAARRADPAVERGQRRDDRAAAPGRPARRAGLHRRRRQPMNFSNHNVSLRDAMKRAQEEDVMVYAIGLESHMPFGGRRAPMPGGRMGGLAAAGPASDLRRSPIRGWRRSPARPAAATSS